MGAGRAGEETVLDLVVEAAEEPVGGGAALNGAGGQHLAAQVPRRGPSGPVISLPSRLGEGKAGTEPGEGLGGGEGDIADVAGITGCQKAVPVLVRYPRPLSSK